MSPRPKLPLSKSNQYRIRMTDAELEKLEYCCKSLNLSKAEVLRQGIDRMYYEAQEKAKK